MSAPSPRDHGWMALALDEARKAAATGETPVGAVLVDPVTDTLIAAAGNAPITARDPTAHAEIAVLREGAQRIGNYRLTGLELFVTLEPCAMCAGAIAHARIGRLVYGADDAKGGAIAHGPKLFSQPTIHWRPEVVSGVLAEASADLLRGFFRARRAR